MRDYISKRAILLAEYIIENRATVRKTAKEFNISKSTVHKDITERLLLIDQGLAREAKLILEENKAARHIRGGQATKQKYESRKASGC